LKSEKQKEHEKIEKEGQNVSNKVYYMKQLVGNACGTVAVMHALTNNIANMAIGMATNFCFFCG